MYIILRCTHIVFVKLSGCREKEVFHLGECPEIADIQTIIWNVIFDFNIHINRDLKL